MIYVIVSIISTVKYILFDKLIYIYMVCFEYDLKPLLFLSCTFFKEINK